MASFDFLKAHFKGDLVTQADADYSEAINRWCATSVRRAKIVAFVRDAQDVALVLKYAVSEKLPIAIRGGGHNVSGASSVEDGLVIDLSRYLNKVTIDPQNKLAYTQGGAIWETVDKAAIQHGLATVGGTVNHTGVAGLTLGGGFGWLTSAHGLAIDNLVQVTIVTADGSILTANESENKDLFWAVRGGGSNFGVVTEFVSKLHEQGPSVYSEILIFPPPLFESLHKVLANWIYSEHTDKEGLISAYTRGPPPDRLPAIILIPFFNGTVEDGRKHFKAFLDLNPIDYTREIPYESMNSLQNENMGHGQCAYLQPVAQEKFSLETELAAFDKMAAFSEGNLRIAVVHDMFPFEKIVTVPTTAMAFSTRAKKHNTLCIALWDENTPENFGAARDAVRSLSNIIASGESDASEAKTRAYSNYEGEGMATSDRAEKLFGENYPRLQQLKKKYDPDLIFNKWYPIQPAA